MRVRLSSPAPGGFEGTLQDEDPALGSVGAGWVIWSQSMAPGDDPQYVDITQFASLSDALDELHPHSIYNDLAPEYFSNSPNEPGIPQLVLQAMLVRMNGLHQGIHRELVRDNPFGVWPLMRAFFELEIAMLYTSRHPRVITAFASRASGRQQSDITLPSMQRMLHNVRDEIPSGRLAYDQFCDLAHTGALATWSAFEVTNNDDGTLKLDWSSQPRFRQGQALIAAAQLKQLSESTISIFRELASQMLS
jgi:hypothetical protein